ncbi:hypothetical protein Bbelb_213360 [Branchiostoma belcheri]|nr:hypothetical protein Bbelb_213360 [Branchiostoma belcheri]
MTQPMLVLLLIGTFLHPAPSDSLQSHPEPALEDAMGALERVLDYCEHNYRILNLDAVIGIRMVDDPAAWSHIEIPSLTNAADAASNEPQTKEKRPHSGHLRTLQIEIPSGGETPRRVFLHALAADDFLQGFRAICRNRQLTVLLRRLRAGRVQAEPEQIQQIASLQERAASLADMTLPELERQDNDYYKPHENSHSQSTCVILRLFSSLTLGMCPCSAKTVSNVMCTDGEGQ